MDLALFKIYLVEQDLLADYGRDEAEIDEMLAMLYECHLKENATKDFLRWQKKQPQKVDRKMKELGDKYDKIQKALEQ